MKKKYALILFFGYFIFFPFGQLARINIDLDFVKRSVGVIDIITFLSFPFVFSVRNNEPFNILKRTIFYILLLWVFSVSTAGLFGSIGFIYIARLLSYISFSCLVCYLADNESVRLILIKTVFFSILIFMIFGIIQYIFFYDLRDLKFVGWDDHYFRLVSTLLDPGYTVIVYIVGFILTLKSRIIGDISIKYTTAFLFIVSILLTYSRAGYLALIAAALFLMASRKRYYIIAFILFSLLIFLLPKPRSSGVELGRTFSILSRIRNTQETFKIFTKYPLFGIGYNNICLYRIKMLNTDNPYSHSCSGSDSSILLLLSTMGVLGFVYSAKMVWDFSKSCPKSIYKEILAYVLLVVLVASFFNNTLFYNYILGLLMVFVGISASTANRYN
jgi:hypothetical protein